MAIEGYGIIIIHARTPNGDKALITLHDIVFIPGYHISLVSYYTLTRSRVPTLTLKTYLFVH